MRWHRKKKKGRTVSPDMQYTAQNREISTTEIPANYNIPCKNGTLQSTKPPLSS